MAIALTLKEQEYVLEADKKLEEKQQTVFIIRTLSAKENTEFVDKIYLSSNKKKDIGITQLSIDMVKIGLVGWKNLLDENGNDVKFSDDVDKNIDAIYPYVFELSSAIKEMSDIPEQTKKK